MDAEFYAFRKAHLGEVRLALGMEGRLAERIHLRRAGVSKA